MLFELHHLIAESELKQCLSLICTNLKTRVNVLLNEFRIEDDNFWPRPDPCVGPVPNARTSRQEKVDLRGVFDINSLFERLTSQRRQADMRA